MVFTTLIRLNSKFLNCFNYPVLRRLSHILAHSSIHYLCVLLFGPLQQLGEVCLVCGCDHLGRHLHAEDPSGGLDLGLDGLPRLLHQLEAVSLLRGWRGHDVKGGSDQVDFDGDFLGRDGNAGAEGVLHGVDACNQNNGGLGSEIPENAIKMRTATARSTRPTFTRAALWSCDVLKRMKGQFSFCNFSVWEPKFGGFT